MMTRDQLRELLAAGWELGAHTMTHPDLSTLDYDACLREVRESRIALEEIGGGAAETVASSLGRYAAEGNAAPHERPGAPGPGPLAPVGDNARQDRRRGPAGSRSAEADRSLRAAAEEPADARPAAREQRAAPAPPAAC